MASLSKPPVLSKLVIKFYKYRVLQSALIKFYRYSFKEMLAWENWNFVFFRLNKFFFFENLACLTLKFEHYAIQTFHSSLFLCVSPQNIETTSNRLFFFNHQLLLNYINLFIRNDLKSMCWTGFFFFRLAYPWPWGVSFYSLKNLLIFFNHQIYQKTFVKVRASTDIFFFNSFFYSIMFALLEFPQIFNNLGIWKLLFYYSEDFYSSIIFDEFMEICQLYNWYLTRQIGMAKTSWFFTNWNYIFTNSTQFLQPKKIFFFWIFFKRAWFELLTYRWTIRTSSVTRLKKIEKSWWIAIDGIYTWEWSLKIIPFFVNKIFYIHNGNWFTWVKILPGMVGYKLGQFSFTRKIHSWNLNIKHIFKNMFTVL